MSFNQVSFGSLYLKDYLRIDLFNSSILTKNQSTDLIKLCEFSSNDKWHLLYRGTRDGFLAKDFHEKCDGHPNTLTIFETKKHSFIFGGYTSAAWESLLYGQTKNDPTAFIFSLTNKDKQPFKSKIKPDHHGNAIFCSYKEGPSFGHSDIIIKNNTHLTFSSSNFGVSYSHPRGDKFEDKLFLAGLNQFQLGEIEVYKKE